jgi:hypothetical protein
MDKEEIKCAVAEVLCEHRSISAETHATHHQFVEAMIAKRVRHARLKEKVIGHVFGWGAITAVAGMGYAIWEFIKQHVR